MTEKPLEERAEGAQNGLKVVEMELEAEAGTEAESQLIPPAGEPVPESITPPSNTDLPVPLKEDPAQSSQSDAHLTSQDMRRAKRIRVRPETLCSLKCSSVFFDFSWCHSGHGLLYNSVSLFLNACFPQRWMCR